LLTTLKKDKYMYTETPVIVPTIVPTQDPTKIVIPNPTVLPRPQA